MNKVLKIVLIVIGSLVLASGLFFAGWAVARCTRPAAYAPGVMMRGWDWNQRPDDAPGFGNWPGGKQGRGMMERGRAPGMMGGFRSGAAAATPLSIVQVNEAVNKYLSTLDNSDLQIGEVMIFDNHAYARVVEKSTGIGAFEVLVDPLTQAVYPEHGANMMWNLKYGGMNHAGMMGGGIWNSAPADVSAEMSVSEEQARQAAQKYLESNLPGSTIAETAEPFYGYYTIDILRDGKIVGMLSVNGFSAQVFPHVWHGNFIEMSEE